MSYHASPEFELIVYSPIKVHHYFGEIILSPFLQIKNSGDAEGTVSKIELVISKQDGSSYKKNLRVRSYYPTPGAISPGQFSVQIPFGNISIQPGKIWEAYVDFFKAPDVSMRGNIADFRARVSSEIQESQIQRSNMQHRANKKIPTISDGLFNNIKTYTEDRLSTFKIGQYSLHLKLYSKQERDPELAFQKCYLLTVFEGDMLQMGRITAKYRYGEGIIFPNFSNPGFMGDINNVECLD